MCAYFILSYTLKLQSMKKFYFFFLKKKIAQVLVVTLNTGQGLIQFVSIDTLAYVPLARKFAQNLRLSDD